MESIPQPPAWVESASCAGLATAEHDPWFPPPGVPYRSTALRICGACPVRRPCLDFALSHAVPHGLWGGRTPFERQVLAKHLGYRKPTVSPVLRATEPRRTA